LFLAKGCSVISFEPNPVCAEYFRHLLSFNHLDGNIQQKAVGETNGGKAELTFYEKDTWLGSLKNLEIRNDQKKINVDLISLDQFCYQNKIFPDIIKIDTEGFELEVLKGGLNLLKEKRPLIIFESNTQTERDLIFDLLAELGYCVKPVSVSSLSNNVTFNKREFNYSNESNFLACP
jgi:FkbM family methyltransferase